jgi:hypothetical protein
LTRRSGATPNVVLCLSGSGHRCSGSSVTRSNAPSAKDCGGGAHNWPGCPAGRPISRDACGRAAGSAQILGGCRCWLFGTPGYRGAARLPCRYLADPARRLADDRARDVHKSRRGRHALPAIPTPSSAPQLEAASEWRTGARGLEGRNQATGRQAKGVASRPGSDRLREGRPQASYTLEGGKGRPNRSARSLEN